ncbi:MAG: hypothetical protein KF823_15755 [Xanthomonadales bacterium]|nr:hypothetical protein [Xanthomonadales bacterium]
MHRTTLLAALSAAFGLAAAPVLGLETYQLLIGASGHPQIEAVAALPAGNGDVYHVLSADLVSGGCSGPRCVVVMKVSDGPDPLQSVIVPVPFESVAAAAIDASGRVVIVGTAGNGGTGRDFRVVRLLPTLGNDPAFGAAGSGVRDIDFAAIGRTGRNDDVATAVAISPLGEIVVVGQVDRTAPDDTDFGVARLRASDGGLDVGFGQGVGLRAVHFDLAANARLDAPRAVAVDGAGRITVAGVATDGAAASQRVAITRLLATGGYDTTLCNDGCLFNNYPTIRNGRQVFYFGANNTHADEVAALALNGDGTRFVVAGHRDANPEPNSQRKAYFAQFSAAGELQREVGGYIDTTNAANDAQYRGARFLPGSPDRLLLAGSFLGGSAHFVQRFGASGNAADPGFGSCGPASGVLCVGEAEVRVRALHIDGQGRGLVAFDTTHLGARVYRAYIVSLADGDRIFGNGFEP